MSSNKCNLPLNPVSARESGEGLPYAPIDFPLPGDIWLWKVGYRITGDGFMRDRYLYPPKRFKMSDKGLLSKKAVKDFIKTVCPNTDLDDFWSSFHWRIPAKDWVKGEVSHFGNNGHDDPILFKSDNESGEGLPYAPNFPKPVSTNESGEGLPYAPVDFPKLGDIWLWKVGHRISIDGFMLDRYLYPPKRFKMPRFKSKTTLEAFITTECPNTDLDNFWSSFHWRIPAKNCKWGKGEISLGNNGHLRDDPILSESDNESGDSDESGESDESDDILCGSKQDEAKTSPDHIDLVLAKLQNGNYLDKIRNVEEDISAHCADMFQNNSTKRTELARRISATMDYSGDVLLIDISNRVNQSKRQVLKLPDIKEVAKGFRKFPKRTL